MANCLPSVRAFQCPWHFHSNSPSFYSFFLFFFFSLGRSLLSAPLLLALSLQKRHVSRFLDGIPSYCFLTCFAITGSQDRWQASRNHPSAELLKILTSAHCLYRPSCPKSPTTYISTCTFLLRHPKNERQEEKKKSARQGTHLDAFSGSSLSLTSTLSPVLLRH